MLHEISDQECKNTAANSLMNVIMSVEATGARKKARERGLGWPVLVRLQTPESLLLPFSQVGGLGAARLSMLEGVNSKIDPGKGVTIVSPIMTQIRRCREW